MNSPRFVALIVNHDSGPFTLACARSLRHEWWLHGGDTSNLDIVVWDNGSEQEDGCWLQAIEAEGARVFGSRENLGLANAIQRLYQETSGNPDDYLALVHPDVMLVPGALKVMIQYLDGHPEVGMISPRQVLDEQGIFQVVGRREPSVQEELRSDLSRLSPRFAEWGRTGLWREVLSELAAELPFERSFLTGGFYLMARQVAEDLGTLMDARFPFYYEEPDLCRRVRERGLSLVVHPRALAMHACGRSRSAVGEQALQRRRDLARRSFLARYGNHASRRVLAWLRSYISKRSPMSLDRGPLGAQVLSCKDGPPSLTVPSEGPWLLEVARTPDGLPWLATMLNGGIWHLPASAWVWFEPGTYWLTLRHRVTGKRHGTWTLRKTNHARVEPIWDPRMLSLGVPSGVAAAMVLAGVETPTQRLAA